MKQPSIHVLPDPCPWFVQLRFRYHQALKDYVKAIPGSAYLPEERLWRVPIEMVEDVEAFARSVK